MLIKNDCLDDQVARILKKGPPLPFLGSDQAFHTVKYWIQDCFTNHGVMCKHNAADSISISISSPRFLPKRIIDVGSTDLRLCQPAQETVGDYVALSYCWGRRPQVVLTQKVAESADFCFLMHTLPPTIRDAIIICRRLGFQYLWVDALCIIQDSPDSKDWIEQSARMDEIYGNAALTIAAASGSSVWDGILKPTTDVPISVCSMPFTFRTDVRGFNTPPSKLAGSQVSVRFYPYNIDARQPLSLRAWTFQEEVLSPQILKFHKEQLVWQCRSSKIYFDGPVNNRQIQVLKTWEEAVAEYTKRNMTVDNDRLVAVAGYVRSKHKEFEAHGIVNRYFAGLWEKNLVDHLLWISKVKPPLPRPTSYRAPTWSWASINGPVEFVTEERKGMRFAHVTIKLLDHFLATNPANPFGTLDKYPASFIHIKGNLKAVPEMEIPSKNKPFPANKDLRKGIGRHWWIEFDVIDVEERIELARTNNSISRNPYRDPKTLYCLRVTEFTALILAPVVRREEVKWFERVGLVKHWQRAKWTWFDDIEEKTELYLI